MLFDTYDMNYVTSNEKFLSRGFITLGSINTLYIDNKLMPYTASSYDKRFSISLSKFYSEYFERASIAFLFNDKSSISSLNLLSGKYKKVTASEFSYGPNKTNGHVDSTGSASGNMESKKIIEKALSELIEKNELFLFWYKKLGTRIRLNITIENDLKNNGLENFDNKFFLIKNISSWPTVLHIVFKDRKLVSYGISCDPDLNKAIKNAIEEARILRMLNMYARKSYFNLSEEDHEWLYQWTNSLPTFLSDVKTEEQNYIKYLDIYLTSKIKNLDVIFLNKVPYNYSGKTLSITSDYLIKCVPAINNLKNCMHIPIVKENGGISLLQMKDCLIEV
ncbi:YcaO-like family protein [Klebsiella grimontii]|uniref:YcaO-like family protein n=1 Tax=Klebsiella grimontii TaxID=2058152 RepID=UPI0012B6CE53